uniref:Uncharacterized protein n=1 Tax=Rhizophora mucronata TaxID=61149 RepID=A0A2P2PYR7_RHIMU
MISFTIKDKYKKVKPCAAALCVVPRSPCVSSTLVVGPENQAFVNLYVHGGGLLDKGFAGHTTISTRRERE